MTTPLEKPAVKLPAKPPKELLKSTAFLLKRLGFGIKERTMEAFEAEGANPYQHGVLCSLAESDAETQSTIADALGYDRSWLVGLLDELEEQGFIERKPDPADRRRNVVTLKPEGRERLLELRGVIKRVEEEFFAPLSSAERHQLHALLQKLAGGNDPRFKANGSK
ncbi:MAG TPA: MarR family transcriptional regulator [Gaiellaceae bacterium]|nr:MarR family transcriptional regulator [Gaiellaceae bacterium]